MRALHSAVAILGFAFAFIPIAAHAQQPPTPAVLVQPAELRSLGKQLEFIGRVQAPEKVNLRARVEGFLGPRLFVDGAKIKDGETLFTIEREPFEAAVDQRKAALASAQATLLNADQQLGRARELIKNGNIPQSTVDQRVAEQARAKADILEAEAALREANIQLSYTDIKAPIAGRIGRAMISPGNLVGPESGVLATIVLDDPVDVLFPVTQRELLDARRKTGTVGKTTVHLKLADSTIYEHAGEINFLDVQVDPKTDGQTVRARFPNPASALTEGQTVRVVIELEASGKMVVIPQPAVAIDQTGPYVFVVDDKNVVAQRRIRVGTGQQGLLAVEDGLKEGEKVIVQGQQRVRPGMTVNPSPATQPPRG
jgi:membrane fusion protein (multidrug efflux system)